MLFKCAFLLLLCHQCLADLVVQLNKGKIQGRQEISLHKNVTFYAFQDIPFAKPPTGKLRFMAPQPPDPWDNVLDCTKNTKICYQMYFDNDLENEDCLYLNVYTPVEPGTAANLPVMYYIYGGSFSDGSAVFNSFGPHYFVENNVIIVTVNYRVGAMGFLSTSDDVLSGNAGLKDINMGLQWVQENIQAFGGDPSKVTVFGQSAGSKAACYQLLSKKSAGLFRAVIAQSGSAISSGGFQRDPRTNAYKLASYVDSTFDQQSDSQHLLDVLQNATARDVDKATNNFYDTVGYEQIIQGAFFGPVIEPSTAADAFITDRMYEQLANGDFNRVPIMMGMCSEEAIHRADSLDNFKNTVQQYEKDPALLVINDFHIDDLDTKRMVGSLTRQIYTNGLFENDLGAAIRYFSDVPYSRSVIRHAQLQSNYTDVYFYQFAYHGTMAGNDVYVEGADRVGHAEDNSYLWASGNNSNPAANHPASDVRTLEKYVKLFTNFATYLNPTPESDELFDNVIWPTLKWSSLKYMNINDTMEIRENPKETVYQKWVDLYEKYAVKPWDTY